MSSGQINVVNNMCTKLIRGQRKFFAEKYAFLQGIETAAVSVFYNLQYETKLAREGESILQDVDGRASDIHE